MARDMTIIDDIVYGIIGAIQYIQKNNKTIFEIFNLGNESPVKTIDLLGMIESKMHNKTTIKHVQTFNESMYTHADIAKAKKLLGYQPKVNIDEGLNHFINWYKDYAQK